VKSRIGTRREAPLLITKRDHRVPDPRQTGPGLRRSLIIRPRRLGPIKYRAAARPNDPNRRRCRMRIHIGISAGRTRPGRRRTVKFALSVMRWTYRLGRRAHGEIPHRAELTGPQRCGFDADAAHIQLAGGLGSSSVGRRSPIRVLPGAQRRTQPEPEQQCRGGPAGSDCLRCPARRDPTHADTPNPAKDQSLSEEGRRRRT